MEVCCQLPVLPLDRPVPQHVLSRRGAISFSSSSALFGCPNPRQLSQVGAGAGTEGRGLPAGWAPLGPGPLAAPPAVNATFCVCPPEPASRRRLLCGP